MADKIRRGPKEKAVNEKVVAVTVYIKRMRILQLGSNLKTGLKKARAIAKAAVEKEERNG